VSDRVALTAQQHLEAAEACMDWVTSLTPDSQPDDATRAADCLEGIFHVLMSMLKAPQEAEKNVAAQMGSFLTTPARRQPRSF
jgi:uncharacterized protein (DUF2267 family)